MSDVKWIKMATNLFDNRKIRQIECLPDGDAIIVIWMKLLCLAGNINDSGLVYFTKEIPYTDQMLSTQFNRPLATIQFALKTFQEFGMVDVIDNILCISNWEKYQNLDGLERTKELTRSRVAKHREKQKLIASNLDCNVTCNDDVTRCNVTCNVTCNDDVTRCNAIDIDKEEDKDKDKRHTHAEYYRIVSIFNDNVRSIPKVTMISDKRKKAMDKVFVKDSVISIDYLPELLSKVEASDFLTGRRGTWKANFDWLMNPTNIAKVIDGNYQNKTKQNQFNEGAKQNYNMDELERQLLNM